MPTASGQPLSNLQMQATATRLVERLRAAGHQALFAGGCVRDRLLGKQAHDIDIATSARPEEIQKLFPRTVAVGAQFGVIVVLAGPSLGRLWSTPTTISRCSCRPNRSARTVTASSGNTSG